MLEAKNRWGGDPPAECAGYIRVRTAKAGAYKAIAAPQWWSGYRFEVSVIGVVDRKIVKRNVIQRCVKKKNERRQYGKHIRV